MWYPRRGDKKMDLLNFDEGIDSMYDTLRFKLSKSDNFHDANQRVFNKF